MLETQEPSEDAEFVHWIALAEGIQRAEAEKDEE